MPDVRFVTCAALPAPDPDTPRLAAALDARGVEVEIADWRDPAVDWSTAPFTMLRSPWDYVERLDEFLAWAEHAATVSALWNPFALIRWNTHKSYLLELSAQGAPIVPTVLLPQGSAAALDGIADAQGWNALVVKPAVGVGANGAGKFELGDPYAQAHLDDLLLRGDALVQPYVRSIAVDGEISIVLADGFATHAVCKQPAAGDYRIQEHHGGRTKAMTASASLVEFGERVHSVLPAHALYARIDVIAIGGQWHVMEVEVTEPSLFLEFGPPAATERLVDAVMARLS
jgi:glutathione synthase/RimK-type ligase-like ATP-grasp enzyme